MRSHKILLILALVFSVFAFARDDVDYFKERDIIKDLITKSLAAYKAGDAAQARSLASTAYFQHFENMEGPIGRNVGRKGYFMERKFTNLRAFYGQNQPVKKIEALIDGLFFDLDEVTPIIQNGFKIRAVASDPNFDRAKAEANARANLLRECIDGQKMFGASDEEAQSECEKQAAAEQERLAAEASGAAQKHTHEAETFDSLESLQAAASVDDKLQFLYDLISEKFDEAVALNKAGEFDKAADAIGAARTELYMNTKLEIAINAVKNINMRVRMRHFGSDIRAGKLSEHDIREQGEALLGEIFDCMQKIDTDSEYYAQIDAPGFVQKSANTDFAAVADEIKLALKNIENNYGNEATKLSIEALQGVYLDIFEQSEMENTIGAHNVSLKLAIEAKFSEGVSLMKAGASKERLAQCFSELNELIATALPEITNVGGWMLFIQALVIILREGLEALIIIVAVVSFLLQSGNADKTRIVYSAIFSAVLLSIILAFALRYILGSAVAGQSREIIEGVTMFIAVGLLLYVGFWMLSNSRGKEQLGAAMREVKMAISSGSAKSLWWTVFLAVFREGAETILFYMALLGGESANTMPVLGGFVLGAIALVVLYFVLKAGAIRVPFKAFFRLSAVIIFYMAFAFVGQGVVELTAGKLIEPTTIYLSEGEKLFSPIPLLGLHPYYESLIPQAIILLLIIAGALYMQKNSKKETK